MMRGIRICSRRSIMKKLRAAAYCRVSTDRAEQAGSLSSQRLFFEQYITGSENMTLTEVFYDEGASGTTTMHRDGFNKMLKLARRGEIDIILTKEVSRFARNTVDTLKITRELKEIGVGVIFINDNIDTRDSDGELRLSIMATIAQEESRKISERVRWGQARKMEQGVVFGRSCLGYEVSGGKIRIEKRGALIVQRIFNEYTLLSKGADTIAAELNDEKVPAPCGGRWSASYIRRMLRNEKYVGDLEQKKSCTPDYLTHKKKLNRGDRIYLSCHHEPIISRELWERTQSEISRRAPSDNSRHSDRYAYSGKVYCAVCGCVMVSRVKKLSEGTYRALRCGGKIRGNGCGNDTLNVRILTAGVKYILDGIVTDKAAITDRVMKSLPVQTTDKAAVKRQKDIICDKKRRLVDMALEGLITKEELAEQKRYYDERLSELDRKAEKENAAEQSGKRIVARIGEMLRFDDECVWRAVDRAEYAHKELTVYLKGVEKGFAVRFTVSGRGENYKAVFGEIYRR